MKCSNGREAKGEMSSHPAHPPLVFLLHVRWVLQPHKWLQGRDGDEGGDGVTPVPLTLDASTSCFSKQGEAKLQSSYFALGLETVTLSWAEGKQNTREMSKHGLFKSNLLN